jgi:hypothetical protein
MTVWTNVRYPDPADDLPLRHVCVYRIGRKQARRSVPRAARRCERQSSQERRAVACWAVLGAEAACVTRSFDADYREWGTGRLHGSSRSFSWFLARPLRVRVRLPLRADISNTLRRPLLLAGVSASGPAFTWKRGSPAGQPETSFSPTAGRSGSLAGIRSAASTGAESSSRPQTAGVALRLAHSPNLERAAAAVRTIAFTLPPPRVARSRWRPMVREKLCCVGVWGRVDGWGSGCFAQHSSAGQRLSRNASSRSGAR